MIGGYPDSFMTTSTAISRKFLATCKLGWVLLLFGVLRPVYLSAANGNADNEQLERCRGSLGALSNSESAATKTLPPRYDVIDGRYYAHAEVMPNKTSYTGPIVPGERTLEINLYLRSSQGRSSKLKGKEQFKKILQHFAGHFDQIKGTWFRLGLPGELSDNLDKVNELTGGKNPLTIEQATLQTWTGQQAAAAGYTEVKVEYAEGEPGNYTNVSVFFCPPAKPLRRTLPN